DRRHELDAIGYPPFGESFAQKREELVGGRLGPVAHDDHCHGRSAHLGGGTAPTHASRAHGGAASGFPGSTEPIHSPPALMRSLVRSQIFMYPSGSMVATSPVWNHPSAVQRPCAPAW